jgi:hypothetical protein
MASSMALGLEKFVMITEALTRKVFFKANREISWEDM